MSTDKFIVKLRYNRNQRKEIEKILNLGSIVARVDGTGGQSVRDNKQDIAPTKLTMVERELSRIRKSLKQGDLDARFTLAKCFYIARDALRSLGYPVDTKEGSEGSTGQQQGLTKETDGLREVQSQYQDSQLRIAKLVEENKKLEAANNELICDVDKNEAELSELRDEVARIRDNESKLEEIIISFETTRNSTDKALNILSSLKKKDGIYREHVYVLKKELKTCKADRDEALANLERQTERFENEHKALINENTKLKGRLTSFKRTLDDVMEDIEDGPSKKKR
ncbi:hypothetical protein EAE96_002864 [Botrytis aclada]|nr:hypothetical protein EAE96_002864 [Botrytis aclada]